MVNIQSKIKGALYGYAIGDAMGATTEFMDANSIKKQYGQVKDIIGGGWLRLKPGEITDDTQMTMCVCEAIEFGYDFMYGGKRQWSWSQYPSPHLAMLDRCCQNFVGWYMSEPKDVGACCSRVISQGLHNTHHPIWYEIADNPQSLGNGSLMRTMPIILAGLSKDLAISQGRLTHNNIVCDTAIDIYYKNMERALYHDDFSSSVTPPYSHDGHVIHTLNNALFYAQTSDSLEEAIIKAVNNGGDADTIAAITGSLVGALHGYEAIPQRWIDQLDPDVKNDLDKYAKLFEKINEKVCTNTK